MNFQTPLSPILYAKILGTGGGGSGTDSNAVHYTTDTGKTNAEKAQARANIGATDALTSIPDDVKQTMLNCFAHVAWIDTHGQDYYDELSAALYLGPLESISAVFTQGANVIYDTDTLDDLKQYLVVTAHYSVAGDVTVTGYELNGTLTAGTSTITVSYGGKTATFTANITVGVNLILNWSITSSNGTVAYVNEGQAVNVARSMGAKVYGTEPFRLNSTTGPNSIYYPIPIQTGATKVKITSNYLDVSVVEFYRHNNDWVRLTSSGWMLYSGGSVHTYTIANASTTHIGLVIREAGNDQGNITQAMLDELAFGWV